MRINFSIDHSQLKALSDELGASEKQFIDAYVRAMNRTAVTLKGISKRLLRAGIEPKHVDVLKRRFQAFKKGRRGLYLPSFKLFFGLNDIKAKDLKGRVKYTQKPHHTLRDPATGRYKSDGTAEEMAASFTPKGHVLKEASYYDSFVRVVDGELRIFIRGSRQALQYGIQDATVSIHQPVTKLINDNIQADIMAIFLNHFKRDLRGRVKMKI